MYQHVALIAPATNLAMIEDEVRAVSLALHPVQLRNGVTVGDVTNLLTTQAWDVVWFATHGARDGVHLSDGLLPTSTLIQLIRNSGAKLVVLNTCESEQVAAWLYLQTDAAVIATIAEVADTTAYVTGALLARNLASGQTINEAFARSKPGDVGLSQRYRLFDRSFTPVQEMARLLEMITLAMQPIGDRLDMVDRRLAVIEGQLTTVEPLRRWAWVIGFALFVAAMPLYVFEVRQALGIPTGTAIGASFVLWAMALIMFLYGLKFVGRKGGA